MPKFVKKPVVIEAMQFTGTNFDQIFEFTTYAHAGRNEDNLIIFTREGSLRAVPGDWIIRGIQGEFYPCGDEIFRATYEEVRS